MKTSDHAEWDEIRRHMEATRAAIAQGSAHSPEVERSILKKRAQELAREPERREKAEEMLEVIEFDLANERYAFPLAQVREVSLLRELTPVPCAPSFVLGIMNLRGEIRAVIDLKKFFDLPTAGITELNKIILIERDDIRLGVLADAIRGVRNIPLCDLQPALPTLRDVRADFLLGITSDRLVVLDPAKILSDKRIVVDEEVTT